MKITKKILRTKMFMNIGLCVRLVCQTLIINPGVNINSIL